MLYALDRWEESAADFTAYLAHQSASREAYLLRGLAHHRRGEAWKALDDLSTAIQLDPTHGVAYIRRWEVYQNLGEVDKAAADLAKGRDLLHARR